jgi:hypothetical protein
MVAAIEAMRVGEKKRDWHFGERASRAKSRGDFTWKDQPIGSPKNQNDGGAGKVPVV